jgi:hypothetical protein
MIDDDLLTRIPALGEAEPFGFPRITGQVAGWDVRWYEDADLRPVRDGFGHHLPPCRWPRRRLEAARLVGEVLVAGVRVGRVLLASAG